MVGQDCSTTDLRTLNDGVGGEIKDWKQRRLSTGERGALTYSTQVTMNNGGVGEVERTQKSMRNFRL